MGVLVIGLVLFLGAHVFVTLRGPRAAVIARIGEWPYKGLMSVVALVGLVLIGYGFGHYRATGWVQVWSPPRWTNYVTQLLMWPASICVVAAYCRGQIWRTLKHPMLVGVKTTDPGAPPFPVGGRRNDIIAIVLGTLLYLALGLIFHPLVVGIPVFGRAAY
jgi:hypothetical protein